MRLQQILYNLLSNAIKFTAKGRIEVKAELYDDQNLIFSVSDNGIGISKDKYDEVFEIFKQGDGTFSRKYGGSGLGLSICKKLVELVGGKIWFVSEQGLGTTFFFTVPIRYEKKLQNDHQNQFNKDNNELTAKILLAEDNTMNRKLLELILKRAGHEVIAVSDGAELLFQYTEHKDVDLIVTDLQMPGLSGIEAVEIIRNKIGKSKKTPIIALTAHAMQEDKENALEAGCDAYLTKPIMPALILEKIQELLKNT